MAEFRQGYFDDYTQQNGNVGIGTSISNEKLEIIGGTTSQKLSVSGIATLTSASGFVDKHLQYTEDILGVNQGDSGTLSGEIIVGSGQTMIVGTGATVGQGVVNALKVYQMFNPPSGGINQRPAGKTGALFYNSDYKTIEFFDGNSWKQVDSTTQRGRGIVGGGNPSPNFTDTIQYFEISSLGDSISFGDLSNGARFALGGGSDGIRGIFYAGQDGPSTPRNFIDEIAMASEGNSVDFGDASSAGRCMGGCGSSTRGIFGGINAGNTADTIQYATRGSTISSFVTFSFSGGNKNAMFSSPVKFINRSGQGQISIDGELSSQDIIETGIIASGGNTTQFGGLSRTTEQQKRGTCNNTRGLFCGGYKAYSPYPQINNIDFINIQTEGNAQDFGDLTEARNQLSCMANATRATLAGGGFPGFNTIDYVTIASKGNGQDFGDLLEGVSAAFGISDANGGLGGF